MEDEGNFLIDLVAFLVFGKPEKMGFLGNMFVRIPGALRHSAGWIG